MASLLNLETYTAPPQPKVAVQEAPGTAASGTAAPETTGLETAEPETVEDSAEFEIVLGRRQIASTSLVAIVLVAVFSGVSYLIGKSVAPRAQASTSAAVVPAPAGQAPATQPGAPDPATAPLLPQMRQPAATNAPIFGEAIAGQVYLQVGVIEKGPAAIWAEGLRTHGLDAFVAPGPGDGLMLWRVMIGPLPDPQSYQRAKDALNTLGLTNFGRRYSTQ
jgi:cell division septation protein DedD